MGLLQEYDFDFKYKRGADNIVPDALSSRPDHRDPDPVALHSLAVQLDPGLRQRLIDSYPDAPKLGPIYEAASREVAFKDTRSMRIVCLLNDMARTLFAFLRSLTSIFPSCMTPMPQQ